MKKMIAVMAAFMVLGTGAAAAQQPPVAEGAYSVLPPLPLYDGPAPGMDGWAGLIDAPVQEVRAQGMGGGVALFNVVDPDITAYLPPPERNTRTAVIIAPGGGFRQLSIESEGTQVAEFLAERGVAAFVLKYRLVQQPGPDFSMMARMGEVDMDVSGAPGVADGIRAVELVRARADEYDIDPTRIVMVGFSAGAHVVGHAALNPDVAARPDYVAPIYGAPFGAYPSLPTADAADALPPILLAMAQDDFLVGEPVRAFYDALFTAGYRPELHLYARGNHGFGMNVQGTTSDHWIDNFFWWLEAQDLTLKPGDAPRPRPVSFAPFGPAN